MIDITRPNYNSLFLAVATALGLLVIFVASGFIFASANPVAKSAMLIGGCFLLVGAVQPRRMLVLLVPITFYLDGGKRLLILTGNTQLDDVSTVLAIAPLAAVGIIIGCVLQRVFFKRRPEPIERLAIFGALAAFVAFGGTEIFSAGDLLHGLKTIANSTVYFLLPWAILQIYRTRDEIEGFLKICVCVAIPVALYGIWQYCMGLSSFEVAYLKSGLTITEGNLEEVRPRPFSTLSSPHAYGYVMAFMLALSVHFRGSWSGNRGSWKGRIFILIYAMALLLGLGRSAIVTGVAMLCCGRLFRSHKGVLIAYSFSVIFLGGMIVFAQPILDALDKLQTYLPGNSEWQQQAFRLGTWSDRLMGYRDVLGNPGSWPLIANPLKFHSNNLAGEAVPYSHDLLSQMILRIGAIPVLIVICVGLYILLHAHRAILRLPSGKSGSRLLAAQLMGMIVAFLLAQAAGSGITVFPMNFWMGIFSGLLSVLCIYHQKGRPADAKGGAIVAGVPTAVGVR
jgi:hypothetical protein